MWGNATIKIGSNIQSFSVTPWTLTKWSLDHFSAFCFIVIAVSIWTQWGALLINWSILWNEKSWDILATNLSRRQGQLSTPWDRLTNDKMTGNLLRTNVAVSFIISLSHSLTGSKVSPGFIWRQCACETVKESAYIKMSGFNKLFVSFEWKLVKLIH